MTFDHYVLTFHPYVLTFDPYVLTFDLAFTGPSDQIPKAVDLSGEGDLFEKVDKVGAKEGKNKAEAKGHSNKSPL